MRVYDRLISLGLNCEISYHLTIYFGHIESSLFQWASIPAEQLIPALKEPARIYSQGIIENPAANMWRCAVTSISFHGKHRPHELFDEDGSRNKERVLSEAKDTIARVKYLREKFYNTARSEENKLYILGLHPSFCSHIVPVPFIQELFETLQTIAQNASLLVIAEKNLQTELLSLDNNRNLFIRFLDKFAPQDKVAALDYIDVKNGNEIFSEFVPARIQKKKKIYKFEKQ